MNAKNEASFDAERLVAEIRARNSGGPTEDGLALARDMHLMGESYEDIVTKIISDGMISFW